MLNQFVVSFTVALETHLDKEEMQDGISEAVIAWLGEHTSCASVMATAIQAKGIDFPTADELEDSVCAECAEHGACEDCEYIVGPEEEVH